MRNNSFVMRKKITILLLLCAMLSHAQQRGFVIKGYVPSLPDGTEVGIGTAEDSIVELATAVVKNGHFELRGQVEHAVFATFTTNNLRLVEQNHWPDDSIRWHYGDAFISNDNFTVSEDLTLHGTQMQEDCNTLTAMGNWRDTTVAWRFIEAHPQSAVSAFLVNGMLKDGYGLTDTEVDRLAHALTGVPADTLRWQEYQWRVAMARQATVGSPLIDLEIKDTSSKVSHLTDHIPADQGLILIDFWASWCGQCLAAFPELEQLTRTYKGRITMIGLSIDTNDAAWHRAMAKHPHAWPQYCTTANGYQDLFKKYQIGNGVPYFLLVTPTKKVLKALHNVDEIKAFLQSNTTK